MTSSLYYDLPKIDAHLHLNCKRPALQHIGSEEGFSIVSINTEVPFFPDISSQREIITESRSELPGTLGFVTTFSTENFDDPSWPDHAIEQINTGMVYGATGVKIWKNVGMELKEKDGNFVMCDHPHFDPVLEHLSKHEIPLLGHLGEPLNCWLPIEEMTTASDRRYFSEHPEYHMYLHEDYPDYKQQLAARNRMLNKHPNLIFIGAHLASLEWSVDELSKWLDAYPNSAVDLAERVVHLQLQAANDRAKVKSFIEHYHDRIIYGSDQIDDGNLTQPEVQSEVTGKWRSEFEFFNQDHIQSSPDIEKPFAGLGLKPRIVEDIFYNNATKYYSRLRF